MTRIRIRYVQAWVDDEGRPHHYFRRVGFPRLRLPGLPGSPQFMEAYQRALGSAPEPVGASRSRPGSVSAAIASYYMGASFKHLAPATQVVRKAVLEAFRREHGDKNLRAMPTKFLRALLDGMEPTAAKNWLTATRALVQHAIKLDLIEDDPTLGIRLRRGGGEFHTWTEEELAQFEAAHPIGSRERLAFALGLYIGQRRGDVIRMGRQHVRGDLLHVKQAKTGKALAIPIHAELHTLLDLVPSDQLTFIQTLRGKSFEGKAFTQWFAAACDKAGLSSECTFHGLRKAACRRLAEAGCSAHEIMAISGHVTLAEVERYTKAADQLRLARAAMERQQAAAGAGTNRNANCQTGPAPGVKAIDAKGEKPMRTIRAG
jgi:integrase